MKKTLLAATAALAISAAMPLSGCGCASARVAGSAVEAAGSAETEKNATADEHAANDEGSAPRADGASEDAKADSDKTGAAKPDGSDKKSDTRADSKKNDSKGNAASQASGGSQSSGSSSAQSQKKWVPEQGHWETDYGQVWVPNVVYVRHERYWVVTPNGNVGPFDSKSAANTWVYNDMVSGGKGGSLLDDSYTTSEDQGHYEQQATGQHWVVDVAGHWE